MSLVHPDKKTNILHRAALYGRSIEIIEWILKNKIIDDINAVDVYGATCLHCLMDYIYRHRGKRNKNDLLNERKIAQLFIKYGVDQSIETKSGRAKAHLREMKDEYYDWLVGDADP